MSKIPFDDLKNKADQTTCPECGASFAVEPCIDHDSVRCTKCGWEESLLD